MLEVFRTGRVMTCYPQAPVPELIAGQAIIATRFISVLLLINELGYDGVADFIHRSVQAWDSTLIFLPARSSFLLSYAAP